MRAKILNASAGSGKTYQLAYKYVRDVIDQPGLYRHILAVTFTNKATEEMKSRILKEIHRTGLGRRKPLSGKPLPRAVARRAFGAQTRRRGAFENPARLLALHGADDRHLLPAHPAGLHQGAGHRPQLQCRDRDGFGAVEGRRHAHRADHRRPRPATLAHGVRAGAHRRGPQMGHPRRHPFARRRVVQGEEQGRAVGAAVARGTGPDRIARRGAGRGDQKANCSRPPPGPLRSSPGPDSRPPTFRARAAASPIISSPSPRAN